MRKAPLIGINRLRLGTDGQGIRTLVAFHGCPLSCRYCLNPSCLSADAKVSYKGPEEIAQILQKDELYFLASRGGVTFGGGEPLLRSEFIREVIKVYGKEIDVTIETSLNVTRNNIEILLPFVREFIVDIKDMDPKVYEEYTGQSNIMVKENLKWLVNEGYADRVVCEVPLIPHYNNIDSQKQSIEELKEMGLRRFDMFNYIMKERV